MHLWQSDICGVTKATDTFSHVSKNTISVFQRFQKWKFQKKKGICSCIRQNARR